MNYDIFNPNIFEYNHHTFSTYTAVTEKFVEYIWIDGAGKLRSKTKVVTNLEYPPDWGFDGSSTGQASTESSDCVLKPVCVVPDPIRGAPHQLALCEVYDANGEPDAMNNRAALVKLSGNLVDRDFWFGMEQEYTLFKGSAPLGVGGHIPPTQGPYYCGVGSDEVSGRELVEEHMKACVKAGLNLSGINAEVMPGQWEFQIGPAGPVEVGDHIWLARYLLYRLAEKYGINASLNPKPHKDLNGAGMHTNFSTALMRQDIEYCVDAAEAMGRAIIGEPVDELIEGQKYPADGYPEEYGGANGGYAGRLTGDHETCSHKYFRFGVSDRGGSIRIPLHVKDKGKGYIEDRRPCADADPYAVANYIMQAVCDEYN